MSCDRVMRPTAYAAARSGAMPMTSAQHEVPVLDESGELGTKDGSSGARAMLVWSGTNDGDAPGVDGWMDSMA